MAQSINGGLRRIPAWTIYIVGAVYAVWEFWRAVNQIGPYLIEPINALERTYGEVTLILLVVGLTVTPLRKWAGVIVAGHAAVGTG